MAKANLSQLFNLIKQASQSDDLSIKEALKNQISSETSGITEAVAEQKAIREQQRLVKDLNKANSKEKDAIRKTLKEQKKSKKERIKASELDVSEPELEESVSNTQKPKGVQKLPSLFLKIAKNLIVLSIPPLTNYIKSLALNEFEARKNEITQGIPGKSLKDFCPTPERLQEIINTRNNIVQNLNNAGVKLDALILNLNVASNLATFLSNLSQTISTTKLAASLGVKFLPVTPGLVTSLINDLGDINQKIIFTSEGEPRIPPLQSIINSASLPSSILSNTIQKIVALVALLDSFIQTCDENATLEPLSDTIKNVTAVQIEANNSANNNTYKGFILEIETIPYTSSVNRSRAVGKNSSGIILISTSYSFASDPQVLIDELKFIIDRDNLKAY